MTLKPKTVTDIDNTFDYLLGVVTDAQDGDKEDIQDGAFAYARMVLEAAEESMQQLGMYEVTKHTFEEAEQLAFAGKYVEALNLLVGTVRVLREKTGTNEVLRKFS